MRQWGNGDWRVRQRGGGWGRGVMEIGESGRGGMGRGGGG